MKKPKTCAHCRQIKTSEDFYADRRRKDGLMCSCKKCHVIRCIKTHQKNPKSAVQASRKWRSSHPERHKALQIRRDLLYPWYKTWRGINTRCTNPKAVNWKRYGGRGIRNLLTCRDLKRLWFRDRAYELKRPSIDRINNDGDYCTTNCRYIELSENGKKKWREYRAKQKAV